MPNPERVLFVSSSMFPLGPARQMLIVAAQLASQGIDVQIASLDGNPTVSSGLFGSGLVVHQIRKSEKRDFGMASRLRGLVKSFQPDVLHCWDNRASLIASMATSKLIPGRLDHEHAFVASQLSIPRNKTVTQQLFERNAMRAPDQVFVPHDSLKDYLIENSSFPDISDANISVVQNAAVPTSLSRDQARREIEEYLKIGPDSTIVGTVAPLIPQTKMKDLIWGMRLIKSFMPGIHLLIIGSGPQLWRLKRFAWLVDINPNIHFLEQTQLGQDAFAGLDILWHSHLLEPEPTAVLTAMANEIPVICTLGDGTRELIVQQQTGMGTNYGAKDEFARWTKYYVDLPDAAAQIARQGREHVEQYYLVEETMRGLESVYPVSEPISQPA